MTAEEIVQAISDLKEADGVDLQTIHHSPLIVSFLAGPHGAFVTLARRKGIDLLVWNDLLSLAVTHVITQTKKRKTVFQTSLAEIWLDVKDFYVVQVS
ncbi:UNVERIFIED_CONTAM: hypothetical protein K2H54_053523 [Gekko kuhli]